MPKEDRKIVIDWRDVNVESGRWSYRWTYTVALYAILHPDEPEVLYLGKADGTPVRRRWNANDKRERVWLRVEEQRQVFEHGFIIGEFLIIDGMRLTRQLVADIESLLIYEIQPWANTCNTKSRGYSRPGIIVCCRGHWPLKRKTFHDH